MKFERTSFFLNMCLDFNLYIKMALQTIFMNLLTGESYGEFHVLKVRDVNGNMVNILTLLGGGSGNIIVRISDF